MIDLFIYASLTNSVWFYISKRIENRIKGSNSSNTSLPENHKLAAVGYNEDWFVNQLFL